MPWLSIHFYPNETQDVFLARALKPFLDQFVWSQKNCRAFFIRYQDEKGPHVRLRMEGTTDWLEGVIQPAVEGWFAGRGEWVEVPYVPEKERFGGEVALDLAEEYFHASTRVVLDRLSVDPFTYGDAMFDALRLHAIAAFGAGFSKERAAWYFSQLYEQWMPLFFSADEPAIRAEISTSFEKTFAPQKEQLSALLESFWNSLEQEHFDNKQPEWERWLQANQLILPALDENLEKALPSLIHLTNNRIGINNQDEVYLNYILSVALR